MSLTYKIPEKVDLDSIYDKSKPEYKTSNPKIDLYVNGVYKRSTNYSKTLKNALYCLILKGMFSRDIDLRIGDTITLCFDKKRI